MRCLEEDSSVHTLGPIIHNPQVVAMLEGRGVRIARSIAEVDGGTVVIRSHGAPPEVYEECRLRGIHVEDATCPRIKRIQEKVRACRLKGQPVILIGERDHPEIRGISGWCGGEAFVVDSLEDVRALPPMDSACVAAQTTLPQAMWDELMPAIREAVPDCEEFPSICQATRERQRDAAELARRSDCMIVIGGKNSTNTRRLYEICRRYCRETCQIETAEQLNWDRICRYERIGIASGASTPDWIIKEVYRTMSDMAHNEMPLEEVREDGPGEAAEMERPDTEALFESAGVEASDDQETADQQEAVDEQEAADEQEAVDEQETADGQEAADDRETAAQQETPEAPPQPEEAPEAPEAVPAVPKTAAESFMEDLEKTLVTIHPGQIITGKVVAVSESEVCVNIGYKSDGIISRSEFSSESDVVLADEAHEGDEIEVEVLRVNDGEGNVQLSKKNVDAKNNWKKLIDSCEEGMVFTGVGRQAVKGGLICSINGVRAFVPASHLDTRYVDDIDEYVGKELRLKILEVEKHRRRVVASRKQVILDEQEQKKRDAWGALKEGSRVRGVVRRLTEFGAFVDIGGIDGLVHVTDLAWGRVQHPRDIVAIGEEIEVLILRVDMDRERVSLGLKQTQPKPWEVAQDKYVEGSIVQGRVVRIVSFGAFVELEPGLDGLVHISQVADHRIEKVEDALTVGQEVDVKILSISPEQRRISLSIRDALGMEPGGYEEEAEYDSSLMYSTADEEKE